MDDKKIQPFMQEFGGDWIRWKKKLPVACHMGGVWKRQIHSAQRILSLLLQTHGKAFDKESLLTLMVKTEGILNSRPLTVETISDPTSELPLFTSKQSHYETQGSHATTRQIFERDLNCQKRWRCIQHVINEFGRFGEKSFFSYSKKERSGKTKR